MKIINVNNFIPIQTKIFLEVLDTNYFQQVIIESKDDKALCYLVEISISIRDIESHYYDVGVIRMKGDDLTDKLDYGGLFKFKDHAEQKYKEVIIEVKKDMEN